MKALIFEVTVATVNPMIEMVIAPAPSLGACPSGNPL
jgi:hypothetical protein